MALFDSILAKMQDDLMAKLQAGSQGQQAPAEQLPQMSGGQGGGMMANLIAQVSGQPQAQMQAPQSGLMQQALQQFGGQAPGSEAMALMGRATEQVGGQPQAPGSIGSVMAQAGGGQDTQGLVAQFRRMFGRDPQSQQELAMIGGPAVSQVMG